LTPATPGIWSFSFSYKVAVYLLSPIFLATITPLVGGLAIALLLLTGVAVEFILGRVTWLPARPLPYILILLHTAYILIVYHVEHAALPVTLLVSHILLWLVLSGEVIAHRRRATALVLVGIVAMSTGAFFRPFTGWEALLSQSVAFIAAATRLFFPPSAHLLHTSLDYPMARLELLSLGMKRVIAVGLRRNKVDSLP
jgi:hypothetical protein